MYLVHTSIEIAASPETVRAKFLDFPQIPTYHPNGFIKSIAPAIPNKPIEAGDKMKAVIELGAMEPTVVENSPAAFTWCGSLAGIFAGNHSFRFEPSTKTPGATMFVQEEKFTGILAGIMSENFVARWIGLREKTQRGFEGYNRDLKAGCEGAKGEQ